jgi:hypothetical protein
MASQQVEKIEFASGNGLAPEAANPQDVVSGRAADPCATPQERQVAKGTKGQKKASLERETYLLLAPRKLGAADEVVERLVRGCLAGV